MDLSQTTDPTSAAPDVGQIDRATLPEHSIAAPPQGEGFFVAITPAARAAMDQHAHSRKDVEVGGILLGKPCQTGDRPLLLIDAIIPALAAESHNANVTFTADTWTQIHAVIDRDYPGASIVGWYHTHPRFGIFLSEMDVFIQRHFFDLPHQVAVVIDPVDEDEGVFIWRDGVPTRAALHDQAATARAAASTTEQKPDAAMPQALPFPAALAYARGDDEEDEVPPIDFVAIVRRRIANRDAAASAAVHSIGEWAGAIASRVARMDRRQQAALAGLVLLVAIIFGAMIYALAAGSSDDAGQPMNPSSGPATTTTADVRERH